MMHFHFARAQNSQNLYQNQRVLPRSIYIEPVLTFREEWNVLRTFFLEFIYVFREILSTSTFFCCLIHIETAQNSREDFSHILLYTIFCLMYITTRNIFLIPDDAVARNLIIIFNFSSQRPHLNYIFLSNVYSFDTMEFSMKHKC